VRSSAFGGRLGLTVRFRVAGRPVEPGLDNRHREISKKHGNTLISTLRQTYGQAFAPGEPGHKKLSEILHELDIESLSQLVKGLPPPPYV
jgi:hypothetical protein